MNMVKSGGALLLIAGLLGGVVALSVPAGAVQVELASSTDQVTRGETITVSTEVTLRQGESIPIESIELHLTGERERYTSFTIDGRPTVEQPWVSTIELVRENTTYQLESSRYGYDERINENVSFGSGRGYADNTASELASLEYDIGIATGQLSPGQYEMKTVVVARSNATTHGYASTSVSFSVVQNAATPGSQVETQTERPPTQTQTMTGGVDVRNESIAVEDEANAETFVAADQTGGQPFNFLIIIVTLVIMFAAGYFAVAPVFMGLRN